eukprot:TRINITY_DN3334_c0_g1_i1.p1 TRINITY_DN3334_c0_g1~~TRINITY_DN3334_c0_g1_i1.p1  ORF type:complete len:487 (-),score=162.14 TRINITY_DN3334_c0_g1_i1:112-1572(-)
MLLPLLPLWLAVAAQPSSAASPAPILFIIQSQQGHFHTKLATSTRTSILTQWNKYVPPHVMDPPKVILTTEVEASIAYSAWTIFPLLEIMKIQLEAELAVEWVALLNENTDIDLKNLNEAVEKYRFNPSDEAVFLGRGLKDSESTIVHHFDDFDRSGVVYPDLESGIFLSRKLVLDLWGKIQQEEISDNKLFPKDFNIDPSYEFAKFVYDNGNGVALKHLDEICAKKSSSIKCITFIRQDYSCAQFSQKEKMKAILENTFVAVKTCSKFHQSRMNVVKNTWGPLLPNVEYFSDVSDKEVPTTQLEYTINTESGHCNKTLAILHHFLELESKPSLLVLVDDDTVFSVARLTQLLACYQEEEDPFILGQRYGYMVATGVGYSYITGGGGIIFSRAAVEQLLSLDSSCSCPKPDTPDDMHLGRCARQAAVPLLHSGRMFQARPPDYPSAMLSYRRPVSFHKHWEIDPLKVYQDYFLPSDKRLAGLKEEL